MEALLRRGLYLLDRYETPEQLIALWSIMGSWHSHDLPLIENDYPWYNIRF